MKILYLMNHVGKGGAALALYDLIVELKNQYGNSVYPIVITGAKNELNIALDKIGVENYSAPIKNFLTTYRKPVFFWKTLLFLRYSFFKPLALKKIEKLVSIEDIDIIHSNLDRFDVGAILAQKFHKHHVWHLREYAKGGFNMMSIIPKPYCHFNKYSNVTTFVGISKGVCLNWKEHGVNVDKLIYDGVREELYKSISQNLSKPLKIIFLGGYDDLKGQFDFIKNINTFKGELRGKVIIDFYGNGDISYLNEIKRFVKENSLESLINLYDYDSNIKNKLSNYAIGVNCSRNEGFGRVTVEYMMSGLCPLVSNSGANKELVTDMDNGLIFDRYSSSSLKEKMLWILSHPDKVHEFGEKARLYACENFSMSKHAHEVFSLYETLLK